MGNPSLYIKGKFMKEYDAVDWHTQIAHEFDKKYRESDDFIERFSVWSRILDKYLKVGGHSLDVGCGSGVFSFYLAEKMMNVTALDASEEMLKICKSKNGGKNYKLKFFKSDINEIPDEINREYDLIVCSSVLEYVPELQKTLTNLSSMLSSDGVLIFSMPNKSSLYRKAEGSLFRLTGWPKYYKYVKNAQSLDEIVSNLNLAGLRVVENWYFGRVPVLTPILRSVLDKKYSDNLLGLVVRKV